MNMLIRLPARKKEISSAVGFQVEQNKNKGYVVFNWMNPVVDKQKTTSYNKVVNCQFVVI